MIDCAVYAASDSKAGRTTIICRTSFGDLGGICLGCMMVVMCVDLYVVAFESCNQNKVPHAFLQSATKAFCSGTVSHQPTLFKIGIGPGTKRPLLCDDLGFTDTLMKDQYQCNDRITTVLR